MPLLPHFFGRLGLEEAVTDHLNTLTESDAAGHRYRSTSDAVIFLVLPAAVGVVAAVMGLKLHSVAPMLTGVAILTGLMFGLLTNTLSTGIRLSDDPSVRSSSRTAILVGELRANIAWAGTVGIFLTTTLVLASAFTGDRSTATRTTTVTIAEATTEATTRMLETDGYSPYLSGVILALFLHMMLTLLMILKRVRATYNLLAK